MHCMARVKIVKLHLHRVSRHEVQEANAGSLLMPWQIDRWQHILGQHFWHASMMVCNVCDSTGWHTALAGACVSVQTLAAYTNALTMNERLTQVSISHEDMSSAILISYVRQKLDQAQVLLYQGGQGTCGTGLLRFQCCRLRSQLLRRQDGICVQLQHRQAWMCSEHKAVNGGPSLIRICSSRAEMHATSSSRDHMHTTYAKRASMTVHVS